MKCRDFHGKIHDIPTKDIRARASVYGIIFNENKTKILLVKHFDGYDYPGGGVKIGQGISEALDREILEETGYKIQTNSMKLLYATTDLFYHNFKETAFQSILLYYTVTLTSFTNKKDTEKSDSEELYMGDAEWVSLDTIPSCKFFNPIENTILIQQALNQV